MAGGWHHVAASAAGVAGYSSESQLVSAAGMQPAGSSVSRRRWQLASVAREMAG
jgi:hypothetical protein